MTRRGATKKDMSDTTVGTSTPVPGSSWGNRLARGFHGEVSPPCLSLTKLMRRRCPYLSSRVLSSSTATEGATCDAHRWQPSLDSVHPVRMQWPAPPMSVQTSVSLTKICFIWGIAIYQSTPQRELYPVLALCRRSDWQSYRFPGSVELKGTTSNG
jgi:hypothetical protein